MDAPSHIGFIVAAYAAAGIIVAVLIGWVTLDYRSQRRALAELDSRGITRRSTPARAEPAMARAKEQA